MSFRFKKLNTLDVAPLPSVVSSVPKKKFIFLRPLPPFPEGEWGGLEKLMFDVLERVDYKTNDVYVGVTKGWKPRFEEEARHKSLPLTVLEWPFDFRNGLMKRFWVSILFLKKLRPDTIVFFQAHHQEISIAEILAGTLLSRGNVFMHENLGPLPPPPMSTRRHFGFLPGLGLWWQWRRFLMYMRAHVARRILTVSREIKNRYVDWWGYPAAKVLVAYHGTDPIQFSPSREVRQNIRSQLKLKATDVVLITTARLTKMKCLDRVIRSFDALAERYQDLRLIMAGTGPLEQELKELAGSLKCKDRIIFLGQVKETSDYLKASDIFVLSSDNEGLSLALMEAMASGLICLSTNCTGSSEALTDGETGFIVEKSTQGVLQGLEKILSMPKEKQQEIANRAVQYVRRHFDMNTNVHLLLKTIAGR